ncbi:hypothetical protein V2G26_013454 [Clonostachys chloroleuca]
MPNGDGSGTPSPALGPANTASTSFFELSYTSHNRSSSFGEAIAASFQMYFSFSSIFLLLTGQPPWLDAMTIKNSPEVVTNCHIKLM